MMLALLSPDMTYEDHEETEVKIIQAVGPASRHLPNITQLWCGQDSK